MIRYSLAIIIICVAAARGASAEENGLKWDSSALFVGKTYDPTTQTLVNTYLARIESRGANGSGYYEVWTDSRPFKQQGHAAAVAEAFRARCAATRSNACVQNQQPAWSEQLETIIFVH